MNNSINLFKFQNLNIRIDTVWLTINELDENSTCEYFAQAMPDGRNQNVKHYNLDMVRIA